MYADDVVLLSETKEGLQNSLNRLARFCQVWGMDINTSKTKIMIFNKSGKKIRGIVILRSMRQKMKR
jgi:hypothetical protein